MSGLSDRVGVGVPLDGATAERGRLRARPGRVTEPAAVGLRALEIGRGRDGLLYVPRGYVPERPLPLVLMLHGAGGNARGALDAFLPFADDEGLMLLAPESRRQTWDVLLGGYGQDVAFIDRALRQTFAGYAVDPDRIAVEGFSDGASYALSLGLTNGDLFGQIVAFSPGFMAPGVPQGAPRIFVSHGVRDEVLPIDRCSRRLVPRLREAGYAVVYEEFDGPHTVPADVVRRAVGWLRTGHGKREGSTSG
jgi:phospholipase/carboxylesterase